MALPCIYTYKGEEYSPAEFRAKLATELYDEVAKPIVGGEVSTTKVAHAETAKTRAELGMAEREKRGAITKEMREEGAEKWMKQGGNIERLLSEIENKSIEESVAEKTALNKYLGGLKEQAKTATGTDLNKIISEQKRVINALDKAGSEAGSLLQLRKDVIENDDSLLSFLTKEMASTGTDVLTEKQMSDIKSKYAEYEDLILKEKEKNEILQKKLDEKRSETKTRTPSLTAEQAARKAQLKSELMGRLNDVTSMAALLADKKFYEYSGLLFKEAAGDFSHFAKEVGESFSKIAKEDIPALWDKLKSENNVATDLENEKTAARLIKKLEDLQDDKYKVTEKRKIEYNQEVKAIKEEINKLLKEKKIVSSTIDALNKVFTEGTSSIEKSRLEAVATRNKTALKELERRIAEKDFEPKKRKSILDDVELKKKFPKEYNEALDAWIAKNEKKHEFDIRFLENQRANASLKEKAFNIGSSIISTAKSIQAGIDLSAIMVQNSRAIMANPIVGIKGIIHQFGDLASQKRFERGLAELHNSDAWDLIKKSGLEILDPKSLLEQEKEDYWSDNLFKKKFKIKGQETHLGKYTTDAFERAYTSMGNYMRVNLFLREAELLQSQGKTIETHEKLYKDIAKDINNSTGRGHLPPSVAIANKLINPFIWSSRLMASALNTLALSDIANAARGKKGYYGKMEPQARKFAISQTAKMAGTGLAIMAAYQMFGYKTNLDPRSPKFGTIEDDDGFSYNVFGQLSPYVRLAAELATGEILKDASGKEKVVELGGRGTTKTKESEIIKFVRGRTTPFAGTVWSAITGKNYDKSDFSAIESAKDMITPMSVKPLYESIKNDEPLTHTLKRALGITGLKVTNAKDFEKSKQEVGEENIKYQQEKEQKLKDKQSLDARIEKHEKEKEVADDNLRKLKKDAEKGLTEAKEKLPAAEMKLLRLTNIVEAEKANKAEENKKKPLRIP